MFAKSTRFCAIIAVRPINQVHPPKFTFRRLAFALCLAALLALGGCGAQEGDAQLTQSSGGAPDVAAKTDDAANKAPASPTNATAQLIQAASTVPRKIIYEATVDLLTDNFSASQRDLLGLVQKHRGYVAQTSIGGTPGAPRQGTWKVRVPEEGFAAFMLSVVKLGELQTTETTSQDVTAEFTDLQARISNKQVEEKRLLQHLQRSTAKLSDILHIEREISRVRGEIEQMQGRLRLLANLSSLTTITVTLHEVKGYKPPESTTFGSEITRTFGSSLTTLLDFGKALVLILVAVFPWVALLTLVGVPVWRLMRRFVHKP